MKTTHRRPPSHGLSHALVALALAGLSACSPFTPRGEGSSGAAPSFPELQLTLLHINDHHSQLEPFANTELQLGGVATRVELGGFPRVTAAMNRLPREPSVLRLHAGDAITGSLYYTLFRGDADAALMNTVCFDAFALGNHEFDDGDASLKRFLDQLRSGACKTPVLAANVKPAAGTPLAQTAPDDTLQPYTLKTVQGVTVGIIGIDIRQKTMQSSRPLASTVFEDETEAAQRTIDVLKARGVRHVVLLTHQGYEADKAMAARLTDVDAIIGGDSHSLLGDFSAFGLSSAGPYPTALKNRDGAPVCIGQAWEYSKVMGEMRLRFNDRGELIACTGQASLLIGSRFQRKDSAGKWVPLEGPAQQQLVASLQGTAVQVLEPDAAASQVLAGFSTQVSAKKAEQIGQAGEPLCLVRVPGEATNRSAGVAGCDNANRLARGSDAAQAVAEAFLAGSLAADVAVQNAGGVRIPIPAGPISMNTAFTLLPFTNVLVELQLSGQELLDTLEDAVSNHRDAGQSDGSHPYAAGLRWRLDMSQPRGARFSQVEVRDRRTGAWSALDRNRRYTVATNDFIASGRDGYTTFGKAYAQGRFVNNYLLYTQTFVDHVRKLGTLGRPKAAEVSHQSVVTATGEALP